MTETSATASTIDTSTDSTIPPGAEAFEPGEVDSGDPTFELAKLASFLDEAFPGEMSRTNLQVPDSVVDVAIRLLQSLSATAGPHAITRCGEEYCNRPQGHLGECGVVHSE